MDLEMKQALTWKTSDAFLGQRLDEVLPQASFAAVSDLDNTSTSDNTMGGMLDSFAEIARTTLPENSGWLALAYVDQQDRIRVQLSCDSHEGAALLRQRHGLGK